MGKRIRGLTEEKKPILLESCANKERMKTK